MTGETGVVAWLGARSPWRRRAMAFPAGVLATLALPPVHAVPVLLLSLPLLMLLAATARRPRQAFGDGWWFGFGHFLAGLYWIGIAFMVNEDVSDWAGVPAVIGVAAVMAAFPGLAALATRLFAARLDFSRLAHGVALAIAFAALWGVAEWLRGHLFTGFPWNLMGSVWAFSPALFQSASLWGSYGLSVVTVLIAVLPAAGLGRRTRAGRFGPLIASTVAVALLWAGGAWRLGGATDAAVPDIRLRIVQANVKQQEKWRRDRLSENFIRHLELSAKPARKPVTHIIWPETAVPYFLNEEVSRRFLIADVVPEGGFVITGAPRLEYEPDGTPVIANSLFVIDGLANVQASYDKSHLVPFGEYVPLRGLLGLLGLGRFVPSSIDFTPGPGPTVIDLEGLPSFSPLVCYEVIFPAAVVPRNARPDWILNITNDGWYGRSSGPYQHLVTAQFRAVEEGLPVVRAAGTGISAVIDGHGRIWHSLALGRSGFIDSDLPVKLESPTLFARAGDWSYFGLLAILVLLARRLSRR